jgi:hypothetical protein
VKRLVALVVIVLFVATAAGCGFTASGPKATSGTETPPSTEKPAVTDPYAAIAISGPGEKAAMAAIPAAIKTAAKSAVDSGKKATDLTGATATLFAYQVNVEVGNQMTMFEVRADGKAYGLYAYPAEPDPAKLLWQPAANNEGAYLEAPVGEQETAAVAAVAKVVEAARPGKAAKSMIYGYMFVWIGADGKPVKTAGGQDFTISIDPKGNAGSWSL